MATPFLTVFAMKYDLATNIYRINVNGTTGFHQIRFLASLYRENGPGQKWTDKARRKRSGTKKKIQHIIKSGWSFKKADTTFRIKAAGQSERS